MKVLSGYNDLKTTNPELISEWDKEKNMPLVPEGFSAGSGIIVWWKCSKGHEWQARISARTSGAGCPVCSNQKIINGINDLATIDPELAEEWNEDKNGELTPEMVSASSSKKVWWKCKKGHEWKTSIANRKNGTGCPYCSGNKLLTGYNDLKTISPDLADEWNYEKNGNLLPEMVTAHSPKKVWWKGKCGHEWQAIIGNRTKGSGCIYCSRQKALVGFSDLKTTNPELADEWNYEKNTDINIETIMAGSHKKVWWRCSKGHEWQAAVYSRSSGTGCPFCKKTKGEK
jgi:glutaredoxin